MLVISKVIPKVTLFTYGVRFYNADVGRLKYTFGKLSNKLVQFEAECLHLVDVSIETNKSKSGNNLILSLFVFILFPFVKCVF